MADFFEEFGRMVSDVARHQKEDRRHASDE